MNLSIENGPQAWVRHVPGRVRLRVSARPFPFRLPETVLCLARERRRVIYVSVGSVITEPDRGPGSGGGGGGHPPRVMRHVPG